MKIIELEINNIRGIHHLLIKPNGNNILIWGPNGSGKSGVVDAIDFLLTGKILRLTGEGTKEISLKKHGPHLLSKLENASVRAIIKLQNREEVFEISRKMSQPNNIICDAAYKDQLQNIINLAQQGQHVLTRREILKFITAEPKTRAEGIQTILNINQIEDYRKNFVKIKNHFGTELKTAEKNCANYQSSILNIIQTKNFSYAAVLDVINANRQVLKGNLLPILDPMNTNNNVREGLTFLNTQKSTTINRDSLDSHLNKIKQFYQPKNIKLLVTQFATVLKNLDEIHSDPTLLKSLQTKKFNESALELINESGTCPLCEHQWEKGQLLQNLKHKIEKAKIASQKQTELSNNSKKMLESINLHITTIISLIGLLEKSNQNIPLLITFKEQYQTLENEMSKPLENYTLLSQKKTNFIAEGSELISALDNCILEIKKNTPDLTQEQKAWENLIRIEENLNSLAKSQMELEKMQTASIWANHLHDVFINSRDTVLGEIYASIKNRFVELYNAIHSSDETTFNTSFVPDGAGLKLEVDFLNKGFHPPHALHSEGHQDSMGLCLYLALSEKLASNLINLVILDDVVMSVDAGHRKQVCSMLKQFYPNRQFLITTHDRTWASQLKGEGVVTKKDMFEFYDWKIEIGPSINTTIDIWDKISENIQKDNITIAAAILRRGLEELFSNICDSLQAPVKFRLDQRWDLGDLLPAGLARLKELLKKAKDSASTWNQKSNLEVITQFENQLEKIYSRTNMEQWAININVHYNNWTNFSKQDFIPVVQAYQDLSALFVCNNCNSLLTLIMDKNQPDSLKCKCGTINWNLKKK